MLLSVNSYSLSFKMFKYIEQQLFVFFVLQYFEYGGYVVEQFIAVPCIEAARKYEGSHSPDTPQNCSESGLIASFISIKFNIDLLFVITLNIIKLIVTLSVFQIKQNKNPSDFFCRSDFSTFLNRFTLSSN